MLIQAVLFGHAASAQGFAESTDKSGGTIGADASGHSSASPHGVVAASSVYYNLKRSGMVFRSADTSEPYLDLAFHETVTLHRSDGAWSYVETADGGRGYVPSESISNVWIRVSKSQKTVYVYGGTELLHEIPADLAYNFFSDKVKQGSTADPDHWRTPEGKFFVVSKNPASSFYKAFVLNYPSRIHAERGLESGLITEYQYRQIVRAEEQVLPPPMNTALGGLIEIHGGGTGARTSWTQGCIAIPNPVIDMLWRVVQIGTPVLVEA